MQVYPAIDIKDKKCVRLTQGKFDEVTVFSDNPISMAMNWQEKGAKYLHLVDLDGARDGLSKNNNVIKDIVNNISIPVQVGGGIRSIKIVEDYIDAGVARVIIGTKAVSDSKFIEKLVKMYGDKILVGIDAKDSKIAIEGWEKISELSAIDFAKKMEDTGVKTIVYTDISKDGMLSGPNLVAMKEMNESVSMDVIASGGVTSIEDIKELKKINVEGVIIGKALYTDRINLKEALKEAVEEE